MAIEWAGLGPELLLRLDRTLREPLGAQLQRELRDAIRSGRVAAGERLPSSRALARQLAVSRGLVPDSYEQLEAEGYLTTAPGSGTRVAPRAEAAPAPAAAAATTATLTVDLRPGVPDLAGFPMRDRLWALGHTARRAPTATMGYADPTGNPRLRGVLAAYLRRVRGASADPERIVVCAGFQQGITLLLRALAQRGVRQVALEDPGDRGTDAVAEGAGLEAVHVAVDEQGIDVRALAATGAKAVVLTPAHQTPTGVVLAPERRLQLVAWAHEAGGVIVEDEYDNEFRYDPQPVGSMEGLAPDVVASVGSVSKSLAPALRLGWIVAPRWLVPAVAEEKWRADRGSPGLDQLALAALIESGRFDRHLRRMRRVYAARRAALVYALRRHAPGMELGGLAAGFHGVATLPAGSTEAQVVYAARERSVGLHGMSRYRADGGGDPPQLVLGFGNVSASAIRWGIEEVGDLLSPAGRAPRGAAAPGRR